MIIVANWYNYYGVNNSMVVGIIKLVDIEVTVVIAGVVIAGIVIVEVVVLQL
jgi:hypothetical protein